MSKFSSSVCCRNSVGCALLLIMIAPTTGAVAETGIRSPSELPQLVGTFTLPETPIDRLNSWLDLDAIPDAVARGNGGTVDFRVHPAICSGLHVERAGDREKGDEPNGNRRPADADVGSSADSLILYGLTDIGVSEDCDNDPNGRFLPFPGFAASIVKFSLRTETKAIAIDHVVPLLSSPGVHTVSRDPRFTGQIYSGFDFGTGICSSPVETPAQSLGVRPDDALDSEDLYRFRESEPGTPTYILADEFGPSIFVTDETGRIIKSYTHADDAEKLETTFETVAALPDVLVRARRGRGFESLAVSEDERFAWTMLQSSMSNEQQGAGSDMLRVYKFDISDPLNAVVVGEFLYPFAPLGDWTAIDPTIRGNRDLKVSAIDWLAPNLLLVSERARSDGLLVYVANFEEATNILETPASLLLDPLIETRVDELGLSLPTKDLRFDLSDLPDIGPVAKMEGVRAVGDSTLVMCEDADFERPTRLWIVRLPRPLPHD